MSDKASEKNDNDIFEKYKRIQIYENRFDNQELEIRKLASVWLIVALGAIAYLIRGEYLGDNNAPITMMNAKLLISLVSLMGSFGLLVLWILDQMVYHSLLRAVFLLGLRMEFRHKKTLPPIRTLMMLFSREQGKRGMARYLRLYYLVPMSAFAFIALFSGSWNVYDIYKIKNIPFSGFAPLIIGIITFLIPVAVYVKSKRIKKFSETARGFDDQAFVDYLAGDKYEEVLKNH